MIRTNYEHFTMYDLEREAYVRQDPLALELIRRYEESITYPPRKDSGVKYVKEGQSFNS